MQELGNLCILQEMSVGDESARVRRPDFLLHQEPHRVAHTPDAQSVTNAKH